MNQYYYEYKDDGDVKYCYPGTQVLVNKFDIHNGQQLSKVEREISIVKAAVLADRITGNFDLAHLKSIHKFLFEDIYDWAGQIRTVDIAKGNIFCLVQFIEVQFSELYEKLKILTSNFFSALRSENCLIWVSSVRICCTYGYSVKGSAISFLRLSIANGTLCRKCGFFSKYPLKP